MVSATITFEQDSVEPPVFVAGAFTDWTPTEMECETLEANGTTKKVFSHAFDLAPGEYQYKFRLGPGDWWVLDESQMKASDQNGNVNNVLVVPEHGAKLLVDPPTETTPAPIEHVLNTKDAYIMEDEPSMAADSDKSAQMYPPPEEIVPKLAGPHPVEQQSVDAKVTKVNEDKHVQIADDQPAKIIASDIPTRKDSIPDFAPPPYSVAANSAASGPPDEVEPETKDKIAQYDEDEDMRISKAPPGKMDKSIFAQACNERTLMIVVAIVAVPFAVSYFVGR